LGALRPLLTYSAFISVEPAESTPERRTCLRPRPLALRKTKHDQDRPPPLGSIANRWMTQEPSHISCQPRLGLFWFIAKDRNASRFAALSRPLVEVPEIGDFQRLNESHVDAWSEVQLLDSSLKQYEFDYFPRGRVDFLRPGSRWLLSLDSKLQRGAFVAYIVLQWRIPPGHLTVKVDRDYRSTACIGPPA